MKNRTWIKVFVIEIILLFVGASCFSIGQVYSIDNNNGILDQYQDLTYNQCHNVHYGSMWGQSFKPSKTPLIKIDVFLAKEGGIDKNLILSIRDDLSGSDLTSVSVDPSSIPKSVTWVEFDFPDISVTPEKTYFIVLRVDEKSPMYAYYSWYFIFNYDDEYKRGTSWYKNPDQWDFNPYIDQTFRTYTEGTNSPPTPPIIKGPQSGEANQKYNYTFKSTDAEKQDIYYYIDWGDKTNTGWMGPYASGTQIAESHIWTTQKNYTIKAQAKDRQDAISDWSTLPISIPYSFNKSIPQFLELFIQRFPNAFPFLRQVFGY